MAMEVEGPDGSVVEFPDGTPHEVIKGAMAKHFSSPTPKEQPKTNQQQTEEMPATTKALKALAFGAAQTRTKDVDTLRKSGAVGFDLDKLDKNTEWMKQQAGLQNYDPASAHFADSSKPWTERIGYLPRTLLEGAPEMAQHIAASTLAGPIGMLASTAVAEGGSSVNRVREADKTDPNAELTTSQKMRVGGNVLTQAILNEVGGRATLGATQPVKAVGMEGVKQAAGNVVKAAGVDAAVGGYGAGADKALIEGQVPSVADVALPGLAGATVGTAFRAPGALKETMVSTRNRSLGAIDAQPRGEVADLYKRYNGDHKLVSDHINEELSLATKGMDEVTKTVISGVKRDIAAGKRVDAADLDAISKASPEAAQAIQQLDAFGVIKGLDNGGLSNSWLGRALNPFHRGSREDTSVDKAASWFGKIADSGLAYHAMFGNISPEIAAAIAVGQGAGVAGLHGFDMLSGASNVPKVVTDKFAGSVEPRAPIAEARAAAFAKDLADRQAKAEAAKGELEKAKADEKDLKQQTAAEKAKAKQAEADAKAKTKADALAMRTAKQTLDARRNSDAMREKYNQEQIGNFQTKASETLSKLDDLEKSEAQAVVDKQKAEDQALRRQTDLMRNSQAVEDRRLAAEAIAALKADKGFWADQRNGLAIRSRSDIPVSEAIGRNLGDSQNVPLPEIVSSNAAPNIKTALAVQKMRDTPTATSAALPLGLARLKAKLAAQEEGAVPEAAPEPTYNPNATEWGPSSSLAGTPASRAMTAARALARHNAKVDKQNAAATKKAEKAKTDTALAKAADTTKKAETKAKEAAQDADENMVVVRHRGQVVEQNKSKVTNVSGWKRSTIDKINDRMDVIDQAKSKTKDKHARNLLDQLAKNWNNHTKNDQDIAYSHMEDIVNDKRLPKDVGEYLMDNWYKVRGTWNTAKGYADDD
jgi:hypothetical protein